MDKQIELQLKGYKARTQERLDQPDFKDSYQIKGQAQTPLNVRETALFLLIYAPTWIRLIMGVRSPASSPGGEQASNSGNTLSLESVAPGQEIGIFRVLGHSDHEVCLGQSEMHLDFILTVQIQQQGDQSVIIVSTSVWFNNILGKLYFKTIRPFHALVIQSMLKGLKRKLFSQQG